MTSALLDRESASGLYVASTVEKFDSEKAYGTAWAMWSKASSALFADAVRGIKPGDDCPHCEQRLDAHAASCPLHVYRPVAGGNPQAGSLVRDLVERLGEDAFSFEESFNEDGVKTVNAKLKLTPERFAKLAESEAELMLLRGLHSSDSLLTLGAKNLLLNEGITELWTLAITTGATKWDATNAFLGVGTSATAAAATDTGLIGTVAYQGMVATYPSVTAQTAKWKGSYGSGVAEFAWAEWSVSNSNSNSGKNLNRKAEALGTKPAGVIWTLEVQISIA